MDKGRSRKKTILLVDDDPELKEYLVVLLGESRYRFLLANNGEEALEMITLAKPPIDLVITDTNMPRMDGIDLLDQIGQRFPDLYVIIFFSVSHQRTNVTKEELIRMGADAVLTKNEARQKLPELVGALLGTG